MRPFRQLGDFGAALAPRQNVGMMFPRANQDMDRAADGQRPGHTKKLHQPVDPRGRAVAAEDHRVIGARAAALRHPNPRRAAQPGHQCAAMRGLGMAVGIEGQDFFLQPCLNLSQRSARSGIVGIDQRLRPERARNDGTASELAGSQGLRPSLGQSGLETVERVGHGGVLLSELRPIIFTAHRSFDGKLNWNAAVDWVRIRRYGYSDRSVR